MANIPSDPYILLSYINTKLRDEYNSLDDLCESLDIERTDIEKRLLEAGFEYDSGANQFR